MWTVGAGAELVFGGLQGTLAGATIVGAGRVRVANTLTWSGVNVAGAGDLVVTPAGRLVLVGAVTLGRSAVVSNGTILTYPGNFRITGSLANNGSLLLDTGEFRVDGNLTMAPASVLEIRSAGWLSFSRVVVGGTASVAGSLVARFAWAPPVGAEVEFLSTGARSGGFATVSAPGLAADRTVQFRFVGNMGELVVRQA
jgi:hypothetical protein